MTRKKAVILIAVLAALAAGLFFGVRQMRRQGLFLPSFITWKEKSETFDLTGDGQPERFLLKDRAFSIVTGASNGSPLSPEEEGVPPIHEKESVLFESEKGWKVSDFLIGDIDGDEIPELLLLVWRIGNYGPSRPFWEEEKEEEEFTQHIFIYHYEDDRVKPVWMSSDTGISIKDWSLDSDGSLHLYNEAGEESLWFWDSWGLTAQ